MINLLNKLLFLTFLTLFSSNAWSFSSSSFLISQSAYKNYDYSESISNFSKRDLYLSSTVLLDKLISSIIIDDIEIAYQIANKLLIEEKDNQEAYIVKLAYYLKNKDYTQIKNLQNEINIENNLIQYIFFNGTDIKDNKSISNSLVEIVVSSFSNADQRILNYNFLLFYISLANLIYPENDRAVIIKGELFQNIKKDNTARDIFENINKQSEFYLEAQKSLAYNYSTFLPYKDAEEKILQLLKNTDNNYFIKKILADFYRYKKEYKLAISIYNELISEKMEDMWNIYYMRGICYERLGDWTKAEKDFLMSLEINPGSPNVLNYLAYGWIERDMKLDRSLKMLEEAYKKNPESFYIIDSLAWAHYKKNNLSEAATLMEKVIDIAPGEAISLDHLGDIYYAMNRKREAIHFWQQALELAEPEDEIKEKVQSKLDKFNAR